MLANINGSEIFYTTHGKGRPLMLMHGGMGLDHTYFRPWIEPLAGPAELVYYDHRGNGRSAPLSDFSGIDHRTWADDADALRKHLGHQKMVLLGHSCGGFVALEYARRYADHLAGLILCCTTPAMDYPDVIMANAQTRSDQELMQHVLKVFTKPGSTNEEYRDDFAKLLPLYFKNYDPALGRRIVDSIRFNCHAFNYSAGVWFAAFNSLSWMDQIKVPTLIISGKEDWVMPPEQAGGRLHAGIPGSKFLLFEKSGHMPFIEEQERFNRTISDWIRQLAW